MNSYGAIAQAFPNPDWVLEDKPRAITAFFKNLTKETSENTKKAEITLTYMRTCYIIIIRYNIFIFDFLTDSKIFDFEGA